MCKVLRWTAPAEKVTGGEELLRRLVEDRAALVEALSREKV
jgi:hypothetical protein